MKIWAHTLVCNEENYLWFAVMSVVDHVDKVLLWDTGSTDNTRKIIEELIKVKGQKIEFKEKGKVDAYEWTKVHQQMVKETKSDWILIVDGDEVWWEDSIKELVSLIKQNGDKLDSIISPYYNIVGDIYHYQEKQAGKYRIDEHEGHINIRAVNRKIPGLHKDKPLGQDGFFDDQGVLLQERPKEKRIFLDAPYMHFTNMPRTSSGDNSKKATKRIFKLKHEIGHLFSKDFKYPEVFYKQRPAIVPDPWKKMSFSFAVKAGLLTWPRKIKRRIIKTSSGY